MNNLVLPAQRLAIQPVNNTKKGTLQGWSGQSLRRRKESERLLLQHVSRLQATAAAQPDPGPSRQSSEIPAGNVPSTSTSQDGDVQEPKTLWKRVKDFFGSGKIDRERLAKLGLGAVASYGCVSNLTYGGGMAVSWILFVRQTGKGPLMPGQWKAFLAFYAGFWTMQHIVRPLRFSVALAMAPLFDKFIDAIQAQFKFTNRRDAFGVYLCLLGSITSIMVFGGIRLFAGPLAFARTV